MILEKMHQKFFGDKNQDQKKFMAFFKIDTKKSVRSFCPLFGTLAAGAVAGVALSALPVAVLQAGFPLCLFLYSLVALIFALFTAFMLSACPCTLLGFSARFVAFSALSIGLYITTI